MSGEETLSNPSTMNHLPIQEIKEKDELLGSSTIPSAADCRVPTTYCFNVSYLRGMCNKHLLEMAVAVLQEMDSRKKGGDSFKSSPMSTNSRCDFNLINKVNGNCLCSGTPEETSIQDKSRVDEMFAPSSATSSEAKEDFELPLICKSKDSFIFIHTISKDKFRSIATDLLQEVDREDKCLNKEEHSSNKSSTPSSNSQDACNLVNNEGGTSDISLKNSSGTDTYDFREIREALQEDGTVLKTSEEDKLEEIYHKTATVVLQDVETKIECSRNQDNFRESSASSNPLDSCDNAISQEENNLSRRTPDETFFEEISSETDVDNFEEIHVAFLEDEFQNLVGEQKETDVKQDCSRLLNSNTEETTSRDEEEFRIAPPENDNGKSVSETCAEIDSKSPRSFVAENEPLVSSENISESADECRKDGLATDTVEDQNKSCENVSEKSVTGVEFCSASSLNSIEKQMEPLVTTMSSEVVSCESEEIVDTDDVTDINKISFEKARSFWMNTDALNKSMDFHETSEKAPRDDDRRASMPALLVCENSNTQIENKHAKSEALRMEDNSREWTDKSVSVETRDKPTEEFCVPEDESPPNRSAIREQENGDESETKAEKVNGISENAMKGLSPKDKYPRSEKFAETDNEIITSEKISKDAEESCLENSEGDLHESPNEAMDDSLSTNDESSVLENGKCAVCPLPKFSVNVESDFEDNSMPESDEKIGETSCSISEDKVSPEDSSILEKLTIQNGSPQKTTLERVESGFLEEVSTEENDGISTEEVSKSEETVSSEKAFEETVETRSVVEIAKFARQVGLVITLTKEDAESEAPVDHCSSGLGEIQSESEDAEQSETCDKVSASDGEDGMVEITSEQSTMESDDGRSMEITSEQSTMESDDCKSVEGNDDSEVETLKPVLTRKQSRVKKSDVVDAAPTRVRRRKAAPQLSKEVIPEHSIPRKSFVSTRSGIPSGSAQKSSPVTSRTTRSKSLDPSPQNANQGVKSKHLSAESSSGISTRMKRSKTPEALLKSDIKVAARSSPRNLTRNKATSSNSTESSETPTRTGLTPKTNVARSNPDTRRHKRGT